MRFVSLVRVLLATLVAALVVVSGARVARADFTPPPFDPQGGSVVDKAGKLSEGERAYLQASIERHRQATGYPMMVFLPASLEGEAIEDVSYKTARAWAIGDKEKDNGVLLVIAPNERKLRIETGKGVGGALTDLQTNTILRERVGPMMKQDRVRDAVQGGIEGIYEALGKDPLTGNKPHHAQPSSGNASAWWLLLPLFFVLLPMLVFGLIMRAIIRATRGWRKPGGYGGYSSNDYQGPSAGPIIFMGGSGGGSDWGGGGGGGGSSDWGGGSSSDYSGGGDFGGGGSSSDY